MSLIETLREMYGRHRSPGEPIAAYSGQVDKSDWGDGPWQHEPDKVHWIDPCTDMDCLIVRGPSGALCGYVAVAEGHPFFGVEYSQCTSETPCLDFDGERDHWCRCGSSPSDRLSVHGGITFAAGCDDEGDERRSICHVPQPGRPDEVWWLGFDTAHFRDYMPEHYKRSPVLAGQKADYKDIAYVKAETESLARQLKEISR